MVLKNKASNKDEEFTNNLLTDIFTVSSKQYDSDEVAYDGLEKVIKEHEVLILSQNWTSEEKYALGSLAVAKHSVEFWRNYDFSIFSESKVGKNFYSKENACVGNRGLLLC